MNKKSGFLIGFAVAIAVATMVFIAPGNEEPAAGGSIQPYLTGEMAALTVPETTQMLSDHIIMAETGSPKAFGHEGQGHAHQLVGALVRSVPGRDERTRACAESIGRRHV